VTSYSKSWTGLKIDPSPIQKAVQCSAIQCRLWEHCKSVFQSSVEELVQVGCSRRFLFPLLCQDDEVNKEMALLHVGHVRDQQGTCALLATPIQSICKEEEEEDSRDL